MKPQAPKPKNILSSSASRRSNPYLDLASQQIPTDMHSLYDILAYYAMVHPVISPIVIKRSAYPIRPIKVTGSSKNAVSTIERFFTKIFDYENFLLGVNADYHTYGRAYISPLPPMVKVLRCPRCGHVMRADQALIENISKDGYEIHCPKCNHWGIAKVEDLKLKSLERLKFMRWNPKWIKTDLSILKSQGEPYLIPTTRMRNVLKTRNKKLLTSTPEAVVKALLSKKVLKFAPGSLFTLKRTGPSHGGDIADGLPLILPALKLVYVLDTLLKATQVAASEHILPVRIISPASADMSLLGSAETFAKTMETHYKLWRADKSQIIVLPLPARIDDFGGRGRMYMTLNEQRALSTMIANACMTPYEFLVGGLSYSGSNVSLRILENEMIYLSNLDNKLLQQMADYVCRYMGLPSVQVKMAPFKSADDLSKASLLARLSGAGLISKSTALRHLDLDYDKELSQIDREKKEELHMQAEVAQLHQQLSAEMQTPEEGAAQSIPARRGTPPVPQTVTSPVASGKAVDMMAVAEHAAQTLQSLPPDQRPQAWESLKRSAPAIAAAVAKILSGQMGSTPAEERPLPEQRPPRRSAEKAQI